MDHHKILLWFGIEVRRPSVCKLELKHAISSKSLQHDHQTLIDKQITINDNKISLKKDMNVWSVNVLLCNEGALYTSDRRSDATPNGQAINDIEDLRYTTIIRAKHRTHV